MEWRHLADAVTRLAKKEIVSFEVNTLAAPVEGCELTLATGGSDQGLVRTERDHFKCVLTAQSWNNVAGLLEPFAELEDAEDCFWQDLGMPSGINLLVSTSREL